MDDSTTVASAHAALPRSAVLA